MTPTIQDTLFQLFEHVRHDPETLPTVPVEDWQEGSIEWRLLTSFQGMVEQMQQRMIQLKHAEQELREKEEQYRSSFEAPYDGINIIDSDGYFVEVNPAFCRMFGYTRDELIGMHASVITAPESLPILGDALKTLKAGRNYQTVVGLCLRKDGTAFSVESHGIPFTYQGKPHLLASTRDITDQVQAQQLLEQRVEERTRELASLLEISHTVASTLQLKPLVGLILEQLQLVIEYTGSSIFTVEGEDLAFLDHRNPVARRGGSGVEWGGDACVAHGGQLRFPLKNLGLLWETLRSRESILVPDLLEETPLAQAVWVAMGELRETTLHMANSALAGVPGPHCPSAIRKSCTCFTSRVRSTASNRCRKFE